MFPCSQIDHRDDAWVMSICYAYSWIVIEFIQSANNAIVIISLIVRSNPQNCVPKNLGTCSQIQDLGTLLKIWEHLVGRSTSVAQPPKTSFIYRFSSTFCSQFQVKHSKTVLKPLPTQETKNLCDVESKWKRKTNYLLHDTENIDLLEKTCLQNNKSLIIW